VVRRTGAGRDATDDRPRRSRNRSPRRFQKARDRRRGRDAVAPDRLRSSAVP
jgi:hypothetical protein